MRKNSEEMVDHLWFHCSMARELWPFAFALFGVSLVMPNTVVQILASWQCIGVQELGRLLLYSACGLYHEKELAGLLTLLSLNTHIHVIK